MLDRIKRLFGNKSQRTEFSADDYNRYHELKTQGLERILGPIYELVGHAIVPFQIGGAVDMYYFPEALDGTAFATMELIEPDGSGPKPSLIGTYELVAFTKHKIADTASEEVFNAIERRICGIFTSIGNYSYHAQLNPLDTCEVPGKEGEENRCLVFDEYKKPGVEFEIGDSRHGLLLCIELFRSEMEYAMENGAHTLIDYLKAEGHYPYSDLDREPVA
jgi:hypothetical protein